MSLTFREEVLSVGKVGTRAGLIIVALALAGCATLPVRNEALTHFTPGAGYRYDNIAPAGNNSDSLLVVLTFSGGGTRAAALCYGVLEKLRDTEITWEGRRRRLLDEVDIISSVSGGSLPAAYFGLFGDRIFEDFPDKVLYRDIQGNLLKRILAVWNWPKLFSPFYGRTDMLADQFNQGIFEKKTFGDLLARNQRPFIVLNATDAVLGSRFDFTQRQFDMLYSDLSSYPVGNAVAASAAFPGLLTPMTFRNYPKKEDYVAPSWMQEELGPGDIQRLRYRQGLDADVYIKPGRPYVYLCDGGVSDNLGLLPVIQLLNGSFPGDKVNARLKSGEVRKIVVITVNAKTVNRKMTDPKGKVLGLFKVLGVAASVPLGNFTDAEISLTQSLIRQYTEDQQMRDQLTQVLGKDAVAEHFPELQGPRIGYHFIEVGFDHVSDEATRNYLNSIPTAFRLKREQIDALRKAAGELMDSHSDFQQLLTEME